MKYLAVALAILLTSCSTFQSPTGITRIARIAGSAADLGTRKLLAEKPGFRPALTVTVNALRNLDASGEYDPVKFANALTTLPINELQGPEGDLYVSTAVVIWNELAQEAVAMDTTLWVKPVLRSVLDGMLRALAAKITKTYHTPLPPLPPGMKLTEASLQSRSFIPAVVIPPPTEVEVTNVTINITYPNHLTYHTFKIKTDTSEQLVTQRIVKTVNLGWLPVSGKSYRFERYDSVAGQFVFVRRIGTVPGAEQFPASLAEHVCVQEPELWRVIQE